MGFNNDGAEAVAARLDRLKTSGRWPKIPVGINLGKSKVTPIEDAPADYLASFKLLLPLGDYFVINVSSPNTPGLRDLQDEERLAAIIRAMRAHDGMKPLLVKIAPDLGDAHAAAIAAMAEREGVSGLIATNTTLDHSSIPKEFDQQGGLSGAPLESRATRLLGLLRDHCSLPIIGSGGVMGAADAGAKFSTGASLVQIYTGFVYSGPALIREIAARALSAPTRPD
jgi:dihydroorotate dehydrogenase